MVDVFTWGLLVPMLDANPDPVKVEHARQMFYNFFSYNTARPRCLARHPTPLLQLAAVS